MTPAQKAAATKAANKKHAATMVALDAAIAAAKASVAAYIAVYEAAEAEYGYEDSDVVELGAITNTAHDAVSALEAKKTELAHAWEFKGVGTSWAD